MSDRGRAEDYVFRLIDLVARLGEQPAPTVAELAHEFGVARRTINRDLSKLRTIGFEVERCEASGVLSIGSAAFLRPFDLTIDEVLALLTVTKSLGGRDGFSGHRILETVAEKLLAALPSLMRDFFEGATRHVGLMLGPPSQADRAGLVYQVFRQAVARREVIRMRYESIWDGQAIETCVEPYFLTFHRRSWYCIGQSHWHKETRTFHLGRVRDPVLTGERFSGDDVVNRDTYFGSAWGMIPEGALYDIRIRFSKQVARNVADVRWHVTQAFEWHDDGSATMSVRVDGLDEISWWVLGYGDQACVLEPTELQQIIVDRAQGLVRQYSRD